MPSLDHSSNAIIETQLDERIGEIEQLTKADIITYIGPIAFGAEDTIKTAIEDIAPRAQKAMMVLETNGGYIETAERIAHALRHHYSTVEFIVPNFAYSAGTVLVMSGDAIHMDYASVLGPIDPQVQRPGSDQFVPALGYLEQYARFVRKSAQNALTTVETLYFVQNFDAAELYRYEQEKELSIALLKDWLVNYKFKNWTKTATRKKTVTNQMRKVRAGQIAKLLNKTDLWHSHSRGIPMESLRRDLNLVIDDFDSDPALGVAIRGYYRLMKDYVMRRGHWLSVTHRKGKYSGLPYPGVGD